MHVIARRAKPDVAIPSIFRASLVPRDCHVALRLLAMMWYVPMPFGIGGRFMNRPYAPKQNRRGRPPGRPTENLRFSATRPQGGGRDVEDAVPYERDTKCRERL